jgi:hypothetical protein
LFRVVLLDDEGPGIALQIRPKSLDRTVGAPSSGGKLFGVLAMPKKHLAKRLSQVLVDRAARPVHVLNPRAAQFMPKVLD